MYDSFDGGWTRSGCSFEILITVNNGGTLTHQANSTTQTDGLHLSLATLTVNSGGKIDVSG
ncbi:MAG: hypothetical protein KC736_03825, partial [Candidatus Moranbacteria bacterium]|nr:hypothetical protein [Candidatus Moranbacteria bacterium]